MTAGSVVVTVGILAAIIIALACWALAERQKRLDAQAAEADRIARERIADAQERAARDEAAIAERAARDRGAARHRAELAREADTVDIGNALVNEARRKRGG